MARTIHIWWMTDDGEIAEWIKEMSDEEVVEFMREIENNDFELDE